MTRYSQTYPEIQNLTMMAEEAINSIKLKELNAHLCIGVGTPLCLLKSISKLAGLSTDNKMTLANSAHNEVRANLASSPHLSSDVAWQLLGDRSEDVLKCLALNEHLTDELYLALSNINSEAVRANLALNTSISDEVLANLHQDPSWDVQHSLAVTYCLN
ncbi:hypothetical protein VCHA53O466_50491 [Vibrio chagasii]|nr:hypothetical protein VCHA53O466_50491 [Vibrio chagasii]